MFAITTHQPLSTFSVLPARGREDVRECVGKPGRDSLRAQNQNGDPTGDTGCGRDNGKNSAFYSLQLHTEATT